MQRLKLVILTSLAAVFLLANNVTAEQFPTQSQFPELPSGSEATALSILLEYNGIAADKVDIANALVREPLPFETEQRMFGGDPSKGFIGNPFSEDGKGVYQQPIKEVLLNYIKPEQVVDLTRQPFLNVLAEIERGNPALVWYTEGGQPAQLTQFWWTADNFLIQWHGLITAIVIYDFDTENIYASSPLTGQLETYNRSVFEVIWRDLGSRAIVVNMDGVSSPSATTDPEAESNSDSSEDEQELSSILQQYQDFDYEKERARLLSELEIQRDPSLVPITEDNDAAAGQSSSPLGSFSPLLIIGVIIALLVFLASFIALIILTLKGAKEKKEDKTPTEEEE